METDYPAAYRASRLWNREMMSKSRDLEAPTATKLRYAILSAPRSGSTLLSRALHKTGHAGDPHEYLNPSAIAAFQEIRNGGNLGINDYIREVETRRTSGNGYFGIKIHYFHLSRLCSTAEMKAQAAERFLARQNRRILITRRDKLDQAVSYYIAQRTGRWTSEHERYLPFDGDANVEFDPAAISRCLLRVIEDEEGWRQALTRSGLPHLEVVFEDFISDYRKKLAEVLDYLELDAIYSLSQPAMTSTSSPCAMGIKERFRQYLAHD